MTPENRATPREWLALAVIALPCMVYAMDLTVLNLAIPAITAEFKPSAAQMLWIIDIYGFMVAGFLITMGTLGDKLGRRRILLTGATLFALASAWAAFAKSAQELIALRALLGVAGATLAPSTLSLISNMFRDEHQRRVAIGLWIASFSVGAVIGPLVGGVLLEYYDWRAVFWAAVPVMLLLLALGPKLLPEFKDPRAGALDWPSVALSMLAVLGVVFSFKRWAEGQWDSIAVIALIAGALSGVMFARRQGRIAYPLLDVALLRQPKFAAALCAYGLTSFAMFGIYILIGQYLQLAMGLTPLRAGIATVPWALAFAAGSMLTARWVQRWSVTHVLVGGLILSVLGFVLLLGAGGTLGLPLTLVGMFVMGIGMAPVITLGNEIVVSSAPPARAGAASSLSEACAELSGALGVAIFGSAAGALYRTELSPALHAAALPITGDGAATLGGTLALAATLPVPLAQTIVASAQAAFMRSMQLGTIIGAAAMIVALGITVWLRRAGRSTAAILERS